MTPNSEEKPLNLDDYKEGTWIQTVILLGEFGGIFKYTGPVQLTGEEKVVRVFICPPVKLGPEYSFSKIEEIQNENKMPL